MSFEAQPLPQVEEQPLCTLRNSVPERVFGYIFDEEAKVAWADKHNIAPEEDPYIRAQMAHKKIARRLPRGYRRLALVRDHRSAVMCLVICDNFSERQIAKAKDPAVLEMFQKVMGEASQPQWYELEAK